MFIILIFFYATSDARTESVLPDSVVTISDSSTPSVLTTTAADSSASPDSLTLKRGKKEMSDLEGPITYQAQIIENYIKEKTTLLEGRARVDYTDITLTSAKIKVNWDKRELEAEGVLDSVWTVNEAGDSVKTEQWVGTPEFSEAGDVITGEVMRYNFKTKKALVLRGRTEHDDGFYDGHAMKLVGKDNLFVADADFTTCDKPGEPHFHFWSKQMKIKVNNKVIARPVVMYIGKVPLMALPFALFPIKKNRHSGILIPKYGESSSEGRSLRGLGYYWAPSQYWDVKGAVNYYEKSGFLYRGDLRYKKRYALQGSISGTITRKDFEATGLKERRWDLRMVHNQEISPTTRLTVNANLVSSDNIYKDLSANMEQRLQGQMTSNATLTKRIGRSGNLTVNVNQTRNLVDDSKYHIKETLPQVNFSNRISNLIPVSKNRTRQEAWYQKITIPYDVRFEGRRRRTTFRTDTIPTEHENGMGMTHQLSMFVSPKIGWLSLQPRINYTETWMDRRTAYSLNPDSNAIEAREETGFFAVRTFNAGVSANTKIYGLFQSRFMPDVQIRHVITPSVSFNFQPDFTDKRWGYYIQIEDTVGRIYDKNPYESGFIRPDLGTEQRSMTFSVNNIFQMKKGDGEKARKIELFTYNLSSSYNWKSKTQRFSTLRSSFRTKLFRKLNLSLGSTHSFYKTDTTGHLTNQLFVKDIQWNDWKSLTRARLAEMTNLDISMELPLSLKGKSGKSSQTGSENSNPEIRTNETGFDQMNDVYENSLINNKSDRFEVEDELTGFNIPWELQSKFSYTYKYRYNTQNKINKTLFANLRLNFKLTQNWKISWNARLDLNQKEFVSQDFTFYRDLHCWEARINWTPTGPYKRVYFKINIKSSTLQDIKLEKGQGRTGYFR